MIDGSVLQSEARHKALRRADWTDGPLAGLRLVFFSFFFCRYSKLQNKLVALVTGGRFLKTSQNQILLGLKQVVHLEKKNLPEHLICSLNPSENKLQVFILLSQLSYAAFGEIRLRVWSSASLPVRLNFGICALS